MIPSRFFSRILLAAALSTASAFSIHAQTAGSTSDVPRTISYQGMLTSSDKTPLADGQYQVTVTLYSDEAGSARVWQDTYTTSVNGGLFNLYLGSGSKPLPPSIVMNTPLWIGTSLNGESEMRPLTPLSASPYALNVPDGVITANKLADKSVTAAKLDANYVSGLQVNGEQVTGKGTVLNIQGTPSIPLSYDPVTQSLTIGKQNTAGQQGDPEKGKGASTLAGANIVWSVNGDAWDIGAGIGVAPPSGSWIGTQSPADFAVQVNSLPVLFFQQNGTIPNIIGGAATNTMFAPVSQGSIIAEGAGNSIITGDFDAISGGENNYIEQGHYEVIAGGQNNSTTFGDYNATGGGLNHVIYYSHYGAIAGGENNNLDNTFYGAIGGGVSNRIAYGDNNAIGGGNNNLIFNPAGYAIAAVTIGGGQDNQAEIDYTTISGGSGNAIRAAMPGTTEYSTIGGGKSNTIDGLSFTATVGGGEMNMITDAANHAVIAGGLNNHVTREYTTISGGQDNFIDDTSPYGVIGGGSANNVGSNGDHATIGGGYANILAREYGTISGGLNNNVDANSEVAVIGGGESNSIATNGRYSTIGGGGFNSIQDQFGTIGGGRNNQIDNTSQLATISGGRDNQITTNGDFSTVGGGERNVTLGSYTTIPGGDRLTTTASYAQTAVGFYNSPRGTMAVQPSGAAIAASNDPLFIVGNGDVGAATRSNAFEVSYNGHTTVYGNLGAAPGAAAIVGARYADNTVYGWGEINPLGGITSGFAIGAIGHVLGSGVYTITLNIVDPVTGLTVPMTNLVATATLNDNVCAFINVARNAFPANTFTVNIKNASCLPVDLPFSFHVTGRR